MSNMTAEAKACLAEIEAVDQRAVVHGQRAITTISHYLQAAATQAQAGVDTLAEEIVALREDLEKARAEERESNCPEKSDSSENSGQFKSLAEILISRMQVLDRKLDRLEAAIRDRSTD